MQRRRLLQRRAPQRALGLARVEARLQLHVREHLLGNAELAQRDVPHLAPRRQLHGQRERPLRQRVGQSLVDADREARRVRGRGELVEQLVHALSARVGQVEGAVVEVGLVGDVVERCGHPVDRHDVRLAEVQPYQRQPLGEQPARALDRLEEVVRAVDLVHLAGLRVADHDRRAVYAPGDVRLLAHDPLGLELRAVIGRRQLLALVEHLLLEGALVLAGHRDRGDVMQMADVERARELDRMRRAADVHRRVALGRRGHVVDGGEVEEVGDLATQLGHLLLLDPQQRTAQVADHRLDPLRGRRSRDDRPTLDQIVEPSERALAHKYVHLVLALLQQPLHQTPSDEPRCSCNEIGHSDHRGYRAGCVSEECFCRLERCARVLALTRRSGRLSGARSGPAAPLARGEARRAAGAVGEHLRTGFGLECETVG